MQNENDENTAITPRAHTKEKFDVVLPPQVLKWQDGKPYIIYREKVYKAKMLKNGMLEVKASQSKWTVKIA